MKVYDEVLNVGRSHDWKCDHGPWLIDALDALHDSDSARAILGTLANLYFDKARFNAEGGNDLRANSMRSLAERLSKLAEYAGRENL